MQQTRAGWLLGGLRFRLSALAHLNVVVVAQPVCEACDEGWELEAVCAVIQEGVHAFKGSLAQLEPVIDGKTIIQCQ